MNKLTPLILFSLLGGLWGHSALAAIAVGPHCDQETLQGAINAATGSNNEIQVLGTYVGGPVSINNKILHIYGGYTLAPGDTQCANPIPPGPFNGDSNTLTQLNGDSSARPVISITGDSEVDLHYLRIASAHNNGHDGGGISFTSSGIFGSSLDLYTTQVVFNQADRGAGIFYDGESDGTDRLTLHEESYIVSNMAQVDGGGIYIKGHTYLLMNSPQTSISNNQADIAGVGGKGGGLRMMGATQADIGSVGYNGFATIDHNSASLGGGIYAEDQANVRIYTTSPGVLTRVENNIANRGGGIYLAATGSSHPQLCGYGAGINKNQSGPGGAIYSTSTTSHIPVNFNDQCNYPPGEVSCALDMPCNTIDGNTANADSSMVGSTVYLEQTIFNADRIRMQGNRADHQMVLRNEPTTSTMTSCLVAGNRANPGRAGYVLNIGLGATMFFDSCTIANNDALNAVFTTADNPPASMTLKNSIAWQPGVPTFSLDVRNVTVLNSIAFDAPGCAGTSFKSCSNFYNGNPAFVDPGVSDYHLTSLSPFDFYAGCSGTDLDGLSRGVAVRNSTYPCDPGAYEYRAPTFPADENFDETRPGDVRLPDGWVPSVTSQMSSTGFTVTGNSYTSAPYSAYTPSLPFQSDSTLATPPFAVTHAGLVSFKHFFELETQYDAAILELSINGGPFKEITRAGGRFVTGGYKAYLLPGSTRNPIEAQYPGTAAWTGGSAGYEAVSVELPPSADGKNVQIRWRVGTDGNNGTGYAGYYLDDIHVDQNRATSDLIFANGFD